MLRLRKFMFERVYLGAGGARRARARRADRCAASSTITSRTPRRCPESPNGPAEDDVQRVMDYIAGMTDRFCIATFRRLALPEESRL